MIHYVYKDVLNCLSCNLHGNDTFQFKEIKGYFYLSAEQLSITVIFLFSVLLCYFHAFQMASQTLKQISTFFYILKFDDKRIQIIQIFSSAKIPKFCLKCTIFTSFRFHVIENSRFIRNTQDYSLPVNQHFRQLKFSQNIQI